MGSSDRMGVVGFRNFRVGVPKPARDHLDICSIVQGRDRESMPECVGRRVMREWLVRWALRKFEQVIYPFPPVVNGRVTLSVAGVEPESTPVLFTFEL